MAKANSGAKKPKPAAKPKKKSDDRLGLLKAASKKLTLTDVVTKAVKTGKAKAAKATKEKVKPAAPAKTAPSKAATPKVVVGKPAKGAGKTASPKLDVKAEKPPKEEKAAATAAEAPKAIKVPKVTKAMRESKAAAERADASMGKGNVQAAIGAPAPDRPFPRATKLPPLAQPLTKREMEQLLSAGVGRGVDGEGSLKGKLFAKDGFPYLHVVGRDKRELVFLLQGPDQEVLPAYVDHKVSVSGRIKKTTNYGGVVDVRKYSAKKPEAVGADAAPAEAKLIYMSPGEVEQLCNAGMGAGLKGFATLRGQLEMTGDDYFLVVSGAGTRVQVSFLIEGKVARSMRKLVGHGIQVNGVVEKTSGWGGKVQAEGFEPRALESKAHPRGDLEIAHVADPGTEKKSVELRVNQGLTVRLLERAGHIWAIEPTCAKRLGLREAKFQPSSQGAMREFFFTPRSPGATDVEFFLAKAFTPAQVARTVVLSVNVKP